MAIASGQSEYLKNPEKKGRQIALPPLNLS
jgi:hypothetical protein